MRKSSLAPLFALAWLSGACGSSDKEAPGAGGATAGSGAASGGASGSGGTSGQGGASAKGGASAQGGASGAGGSAGGKGGGVAVAGAESGGAGGAAAGMGGAGGSAGVSPAAAVCADYVEVYCTHFAECFPLSFKTNYGEVAACRERLAPSCVDELDAAGSPLTPESLRTCAEALSGAACTEGGISRPIAECVFAGDREVGAGCRYDSQCESAFCNRPLRTWCGVCAAQAASGETCEPNRPSGCDEGLVCSTTGSCMSPMGAGAACEVGAQCESGLICGAEPPRTCVPASEVDEPCTSGADCRATSDAYCDTAAGQCAAASYSVEAGPCDFANGRYCLAQGVCRGEDLTPQTSGVCAPPVEDGGACDRMRGDTCRAPALCVEGVCVAPPPATTCPD